MMYEWTWDRVSQWPWLFKGGLVLFLSLLGFVAGYWCVVRQTVNDYHQGKVQEVALQQRFDAKQHEASLLESYRQEQKILQQRIVNRTEWVSMSYEWSGLWDDIVNEGRASHVVLESVMPQVEKKYSFYRELPIKIITIGSYPSLVLFLNRVATMKRLLVVHDFAIKQQGEQLVMSVDVSAYQAMKGIVSIKDSPALADRSVIKAPHRDIFQRDDFSLATLQWIGVLRQGPRVWALLKSPNDVLSRVGVGDVIGNHHDKVVAINETVMRIESVTLTKGIQQKKETLMQLGDGVV